VRRTYSDIPFENPIAGIRVGLIDGKYIINPTYDQRRESELNLIVAGTEEAICMVEAGGKRLKALCLSLNACTQGDQAALFWQKEL
jgi:polyribonucleotide nucleotidyltransferase